MKIKNKTFITPQWEIDITLNNQELEDILGVFESLRRYQNQEKFQGRWGEIEEELKKITNP
jgi:hypothetical protein